MLLCNDLTVALQRGSAIPIAAENTLIIDVSSSYHGAVFLARNLPKPSKQVCVSVSLGQE